MGRAPLAPERRPSPSKLPIAQGQLRRPRCPGLAPSSGWAGEAAQRKVRSRQAAGGAPRAGEPLTPSARPESRRIPGRGRRCDGCAACSQRSHGGVCAPTGHSGLGLAGRPGGASCTRSGGQKAQTPGHRGSAPGGRHHRDRKTGPPASRTPPAPGISGFRIQLLHFSRAREQSRTPRMRLLLTKLVRMRTADGINGDGEQILAVDRKSVV